MPLIIICIEDMKAAVFCLWTVASADIQENIWKVEGVYIARLLSRWLK